MRVWNVWISGGKGFRRSYWELFPDCAVFSARCQSCRALSLLQVDRHWCLKIHVIIMQPSATARSAISEWQSLAGTNSGFVHS